MYENEVAISKSSERTDWFTLMGTSYTADIFLHFESYMFLILQPCMQVILGHYSSIALSSCFISNSTHGKHG